MGMRLFALLELSPLSKNITPELLLFESFIQLHDHLQTTLSKNLAGLIFGCFFSVKLYPKFLEQVKLRTAFVSNLS